MQHNELKQRLERIEKNIDEAVHICEENARFPRKLRDSIAHWKEQAGSAEAICHSNDGSRIFSYVNDLQKIGARAQAALDDIIGPDTKIRNEVMHVNNELADLKGQLH